MSMSELPVEELVPLDTVSSSTGTDPNDAYDGGWEQGLEEGDGFEDHLLGEQPTTPEL
jgi:hypothetical protein